MKPQITHAMLEKMENEEDKKQSSGIHKLEQLTKKRDGQSKRSLIKLYDEKQSFNRLEDMT